MRLLAGPHGSTTNIWGVSVLLCADGPGIFSDSPQATPESGCGPTTCRRTLRACVGFAPVPRSCHQDAASWPLPRRRGALLRLPGRLRVLTGSTHPSHDVGTHPRPSWLDAQVPPRRRRRRFGILRHGDDRELEASVVRRRRRRSSRWDLLLHHHGIWQASAWRGAYPSVASRLHLFVGGTRRYHVSPIVSTSAFLVLLPTDCAIQGLEREG